MVVECPLLNEQSMHSIHSFNLRLMVHSRDLLYVDTTKVTFGSFEFLSYKAL